MANVLHKTTLLYKTSVNTTDYLNDDWLINPDLSNVQNIPKEYWKVENNLVVEMSQEEKDTVYANKLQNAKNEHNAKLWQAAYDYNFQYISGGAYTQIHKLEILENEKAIDDAQWVLTLWLDYYNRVSIMQAATTIEDVESVSLDFSNNGQPPYKVGQLLGIQQ